MSSFLVLMDSSLQLCCFYSPVCQFFVSILVLMDSSLQSIIIRFNNLTFLVSILVLMDSSLQFTMLTAYLGVVYCFNPCFNGFFSSIMFSEIRKDIKKCFNPCFNGFFSSMEIVHGGQVHRITFQSLF